MKIQNGLTSLFKGLLVAAVLLGTVRCTSGAGGLQASSGATYYNPYNNQTYATTCTAASLQGALIRNPAGDVQVGTTVTWQLSAGGCTNLIFTPVGLSQVQVLNGTVSYTKTYTQAMQNVQESGTLTALNSSGVAVGSITVSSQNFNIVSGSVATGLACQAVAAQSTLIVPVDSANHPLGNPPTDSFTVSSDRPIRIVSVRNLNGIINPLSDPSAMPAASSLTFQASIPAIGVDSILMTVVDAANPQNQASCMAVVNVQTQVVQTGPAPTCSLTLSQNTFAPGAPMVLNLVVQNGPAASMSLVVNNQLMANPVVGANTITAPYASGSATVTILSSTGVANTCGVNFTIGTQVTDSGFDCDSKSKKLTICPVAGKIVSVSLDHTDWGSAACTQGSSWGVDLVNNNVWVNNNCKGDFIVTYLR